MKARTHNARIGAVEERKLAARLRAEGWVPSIRCVGLGGVIFQLQSAAVCGVRCINSRLVRRGAVRSSCCFTAGPPHRADLSDRLASTWKHLGSVRLPAMEVRDKVACKLVETSSEQHHTRQSAHQMHPAAKRDTFARFSLA